MSVARQQHLGPRLSDLACLQRGTWYRQILFGHRHQTAKRKRRELPRDGLRRKLGLNDPQPRPDSLAKHRCHSRRAAAPGKHQAAQLLVRVAGGPPTVWSCGRIQAFFDGRSKARATVRP